MEVKINKEIRDYTESVFFGLSLRQSLFSALACAVAAGLYFLLRSRLGTEALSWVCLLGAFPFAALGFVKYNGMTAEAFFRAWIKSELLTPKRLVFQGENFYYEAMKPWVEAYERGSVKLPEGKRKKRFSAGRPGKKKKRAPVRGKRSKEAGKKPEADKKGDVR